MEYTTDLTLRQRNFILENFPEIFNTKSKSDIFEILNALFFLIKTGCQWRLIPNDFPKWITFASANRHASASACFGHNATALLPHCANTSARCLTAPTLTNIEERGLNQSL